MNTHLKQLWAAMKLPKNFKKSYKFFCLGLDIRVAQIVKADAPQMIILQDNLERIGEIIRLEQIAHCVYADVVCVFFVVAPTAQLAVFFLFLLQGQ
ncbi:hypothetical protein [Gemmiger formicilis]|uniref:hypothetical protein n=1 Tax=Gemmiger formicilis TaxID=745368 RepID=UPI0035229A78